MAASIASRRRWSERTYCGTSGDPTKSSILHWGRRTLYVHFLGPRCQILYLKEIELHQKKNIFLLLNIFEPLPFSPLQQVHSFLDHLFGAAMCGAAFIAFCPFGNPTRGSPWERPCCFLTKHFLWKFSNQQELFNNIEESLEVKLPTIYWQKSRREKVRRKKMQMREKVGKRRNSPFSNDSGSRKVGWLKRWVRRQDSRPEMKNYTPLCVYSVLQCSEGKRLVNHQKWFQSSVFWKFWLRHVLLAPQRHALFWHLTFQKWSENGIFFKIWFLHCTLLHTSTPIYTSLHYSTPHCAALRYTSLHEIALHSTTLYHTTIHNLPLHEIPLTTLHNTTTSTKERHPTNLTAQNGTRVHQTHYLTLHDIPPKTFSTNTLQSMTVLHREKVGR
jgi:hypothetical protein